MELLDKNKEFDDWLVNICAGDKLKNDKREKEFNSMKKRVREQRNGQKR